MKFKQEDTITIPVPEQFQKDWGPILHNWLQKNHQKPTQPRSLPISIGRGIGE